MYIKFVNIEINIIYELISELIQKKYLFRFISFVVSICLIVMSFGHY